MNFVAATKSQSRVFVAEGLPGPNNPPAFQGCLVMGSASQDHGSVDYIWCPDPENYTKFVKVGEILGREESVETSLSGHFPLSTLSNIRKWGKAKTPLAIHVHFGLATNPQDFNVFEKAVIFDDSARVTSTEVEEMGALDESDMIGQSADITALDYYEVVALSYISRQAASLDWTVAGVATENVYDQTIPVDNRFAYYAVTAGDGISIDPLLLYTVDGGTTWATITITDLAAKTASGVAVLSDVPIVLGTAADFYYADVLGGASSMTKVTVAQAWTCITSTGTTAYIGGAAGYVGKLIDYTAAPTTLATLSADAVTSIHALDGGIIVAGDSGGSVWYSSDGENFTETAVDAGNSIDAVFAIDADTLWAGSAAGSLWFSTDAGATWTERSFSGSGAGAITGITFSERSVGFFAHDPAAGNAKIFKTVGAGASGTWFEVPRSGSLPSALVLHLASVWGQPNKLLAGGEGAIADDGIVILGLGS